MSAKTLESLLPGLQSPLFYDAVQADKATDLFYDYFCSLGNNSIMSQAFVRESDDQWLDEVSPTISALINFLTKENGGIRVYEKSNHSVGGRTIHVMSNGLSYSKDDSGKWCVVG